MYKRLNEGDNNMFDRTIEDMHLLNLNANVAKEFTSIKGGVSTALDCIKEYIEKLRYKNGRRIRAERRESMLKVLKVLYYYLKTDDSDAINFGECTPSMRTIAFNINPDIEMIQEIDTPAEIKRKEKIMSNTLMLVQRSIETLREFGIIVAHSYRAETNRNDNPLIPNKRLPNFYYELVSVSNFSSAFEFLLNKASLAMLKLGTIIKNIKKQFCTMKDVIFNDKTPDWFLEETIVEKKIKETGVYLLC
jgi:hypothetical protein